MENYSPDFRFNHEFDTEQQLVRQGKDIPLLLDEIFPSAAKTGESCGGRNTKRILRVFAWWGSGSLSIFVLYLQNKSPRVQKYFQGARNLLPNPPSSLGVRGRSSILWNSRLWFCQCGGTGREKGRKDGSQPCPNRLNTTPLPSPGQNSGIKHMENTNRPSRAAKPKVQNV